ncbi:Retrovirus-related Pol polyprotein from transposon RE1 [Sesamum angolense]|uniref:Retrovirus-related Pol polyprotein from transposon RE1 n=1 Tax=Sesamum angolense TaxID=2727404 RepID=A0AAE1VUH5_9LAMI|nr:Retrovirus-related Pol polyprotein from transposon RE1 [Sesamum angolense]
MEPLPHVDKAFSMVMRVERQRKVHMETAETGINNAMYARNGDQERIGYKTFVKKKNVDKRKRKEVMRGEYTWLQRLKRIQRLSANSLIADLMEALKLVQNRSVTDPVKVHFAQFEEELAGMAFNTDHNRYVLGAWIVDTGATRYVDQRTEEVLAIGNQIGKLFYLTPSSFSSTAVNKRTKSVPEFVHLSQDCTSYELWHKRLDISTSCPIPLPISSSSVPTSEGSAPVPDIHTDQPITSVPISDFSSESSPVRNETSLSRLPSTEPLRKSTRSTHPPVCSRARTYTQAKEHSEWQQAMHQELTALEENKTWEVVDLPSDKRAIGFTVRIFLALASGYSWAIHQVDINNAFLHGYLDEDIYMIPPEGYNVSQGKVCKLRRSLYGLKQASRQWNQEFTSQLLKYGFMQSQNDHCLFIQTRAHDVVFLLVYVDDVLITSSKESLISPVKDYLHKLFTIKDMGPAKYFLGLEIARSSAGTSVTQQKYIRDLVVDAGLEHAKSVVTPLPLGLKLTSCGGPVLVDPEPYRRGLLPRLFFPVTNSFSLKAYCDADWASCIDSRRSLTGYCVFLGSALISWKTKKQPTVSRSSAEAEYRSLASTVCELRWISYLLQDFRVHVQTPIPLFCDNQAAVHITANPIFHERTKHLEIDCHLVREKYKEGFVLPSHISGKQQLADIFTKCLPGPAFSTLLFKLGLVDFSPSPT